jgi:hypothetical protein
MKNIHVLSTDKPSRLVKQKYDTLDRLCLADIATKRAEYKRFNIYITSNEEIKEGDYYYLPRTNSVYKCNEDPTELNLEGRLGVAKIILTTDQDLIKDGVQAIDDKFLEWFVKNPSCEEVEVKKLLIGKDIPKINFTYKIILPKEEPKQETLEEAAEKHFLNSPDAYGINEECRNSFIEGAKWQQERSYSEEEVRKAIQETITLMRYKATEFREHEDTVIEQFKKK